MPSTKQAALPSKPGAETTKEHLQVFFTCLVAWQSSYYSPTCPLSNQELKQLKTYLPDWIFSRQKRTKLELIKRRKPCVLGFDFWCVSQKSISWQISWRKSFLCLVEKKDHVICISCFLVSVISIQMSKGYLYFKKGHFLHTEPAKNICKRGSINAQFASPSNFDIERRKVLTLTLLALSAWVPLCPICSCSCSVWGALIDLRKGPVPCRNRCVLSTKQFVFFSSTIRPVTILSWCKPTQKICS